MNKCDLCSNPILFDFTAISAEDMRQAVFKNGFTPWKAGLRFDLISPDVETFWKQNVAQDQSDWHICPTCMQKLSPYLTGKPQAKGIASWAVSQDTNDLARGLADAEAKYKGSSGNLIQNALASLRNKEDRDQPQKLVRYMGLVLLVIGLVGLFASMTTDWATVPVDTDSSDGIIRFDGPLVFSDEGEFATRDNVLGTNIIVGSVLMGGLSLVAAAGLLMFYPGIVLNLRQQQPVQIKTRQMAVIGSVLALATPFGYALLSDSDLEAGWRNAAFAGFLAALFAGIRWFLPEVQIPEKKIVEKKVAPAPVVKEEPVTADEEIEEEERDARNRVLNIVILVAAALGLVALVVLNNQSDESSEETASGDVPPTWVDLPTALPTSLAAAEVPATEVPFVMVTPTETYVLTDTPTFAPTLTAEAPTETPATTPTPLPAINASNATRLQAMPGCHHIYYVKSVAFSPDGKFVITGDYDGNVNLWNVGECGSEPVKKFRTNLHEVDSLALSPDGKVLAAGLMGIELWDFAAATLMTTMTSGTYDLVDGLAFSPDGRLLASSQGEALWIWDIETQKPIETLEVGGRASGLAFSPDGQLLASSYSYGYITMVTLWDAQDWTEVQQLEMPTGSHPSVAFSPDGKWLAASGDHQLRIWSTSDFSLQYESPYDSPYGLSIAFSPDSTLLVSSSTGTVRLVDVNSWTQVHLLNVSGKVNAVAFSPDGAWLAAGCQGDSDYDGANQLQLWHVGD
jgi:hypothetical protein